MRTTTPFQVLIHLVLAIGCALFAMACKGESESELQQEDRPNSTRVFVDEDVSDAQLGEYHVILEVQVDGKDAGSMTVKLWPEIAPQTVRNFLRIASRGFYDGLTFHRVLRTFMVQGGCERGNGSGSGPLPAIPGEFSESEAARHAYGTLSMARGNNPNSAGAQFFIICDDGRPAWSLDGKYASFGQVVEGTEALEAIASVPVTSNFQGEVSQPTQRIEIVSVQVQRGGLPDAIPIQQPDREQNREGWPNTVEVESLLVAVGGGLLPVERSLDEAMTLAQSLLQRAQGGEDFQSLVRQYSDDPSQQAHEDPVGYRFSDTGCSPKAGQREVFQLNNEYQEKFNELEHSKRNGILTSEQVAEQARGFQVEILRRIRKAAFIPREQRRALADPAFEMEVGEIKLVPRDPSRTLEGVYLLHRIR